MGRRKRYIEPFEVKIEYLGKGGVGVGKAPDGLPVDVRGAPPDSVVHVIPFAKKKGRWKARRASMVEAPGDYQDPPCEVFGLCGGCALQEISLESQRHYKYKFALEEVAAPIKTSWCMET